MHPIRSAPRALLLGTAAGLLLAGGPTRAAEVLARIGTAEVTVDEVRAYVQTLAPDARAALAKDHDLLAGMVRAYVAGRAVLAEAQARKFDQQPAVRLQLDRAREQALSELYLESVSRPPDDYPSEEDVQATYRGNRPLFVTPRRYHLAQIYLAAPRATDKPADKAAEAKVRRRAAELARKLRLEGADFAATARAESGEKETAERGGEIGWLTEEQILPGIRAAATALASGGVSDPIRLADGWHVLKLLGVEPAAVRPLAEVRDAVVAQMRLEKARELREQHVSRLLGQDAPAINELALPLVIEPAR